LLTQEPWGWHMCFTANPSTLSLTQVFYGWPMYIKDIPAVVWHTQVL